MFLTQVATGTRQNIDHMPSDLDEASQITPSQFAHLKTIEPTSTVLGVVPHRALLDTPSPNYSPPVLKRSHRTRKPSTRKAEASQVEANTSNCKGRKLGKSTGKKSHHKNIRNGGVDHMSKSVTKSASQARGAEFVQEEQHSGYHDDDGDDKDEDEGEGEVTEDEECEEDEGINPAIISLLEEFVGHSVGHLSHAQLKRLLETMPATQTFAMETQAEPSSAISKLSAGVGLAGSNCNGPSPHADDGPYSQKQSTSTTSCNAITSQKRQSDAPGTSSTSKRVCLAINRSGRITEEESDADSDTIHRRKSSSGSDLSSDSSPDPDSDSGLCSATFPQLQYPPAGPRGGKGLKVVRSKQVPTIQSASTTSCVPFTTFTHPTPSTSLVKTATALKYPQHSSTLLARHLPPNDLSDLDALTAWALKIAQEQSQLQTPDASPSCRTQQPDHPSTTSSHIMQVLANHRSQLDTVVRPSLQTTSSHSLQATGTNPTLPGVTTPHSDDTPALNIATTPGQHKSKRNKKPSLGDFPGVTGEVASAAIPYFLATVFSEGAYENIEVFRDWALDAYNHTWAIEYPESEYEAPPKALLVIMTRRVSWLRGEVKKRIRAIVQYGYEFRNPTANRGDIKHNQRTAKKLSANNFHCRNLKPAKDPFEHTEFIRGIGAGLFWDPESIGVVFYDRFKEVPIPAVALILTMMQNCISEWKSGKFKTRDLDAEKQQVEYERHLLGLYEYERAAGARLTRFRQAWAKAGLKYSGADLDNNPDVIQPYILASQIRPDTPPPGDEDEGDYLTSH